VLLRSTPDVGDSNQTRTMSEPEPVQGGRDAYLANATETYEVDPFRSSVMFSVKHAVGHVTGSFTRVEGTLRFNPSDFAATEARITVDARSIDTGNPDRDKHLRSSAFLAAERYPEISFESTRADLVDGNVFEMPGNLTMHGRTNPVMLQVTYLGMATVEDGVKQAVFDARAHISRRAFGMSLPKTLELGSFLVSDRIDLIFDIHASQLNAPR